MSATNATETAYLEVPGDAPCRACSVWGVFKDTLLDSGCIGVGGGDDDGDEACRWVGSTVGDTEDTARTPWTDI